MSESKPEQTRQAGRRALGLPDSLGSFASTALVALPVLSFFALLATAAVNVPYLDDYDTILRFLLETREPSAETLRLLLAQHVEHRLVFLRAVALGLAGTGPINFVTLAWLGCLGLTLGAAGFFVAFRPNGREGAPVSAKLLWFAPAALALFQPQFWDAFFWATSALSNLWVLPLALATLLVLARGGFLAMACAAALAAATTLTQGNGLLVLPAGLLLLGLTRRPGAAVVWLGSCALIGGLYALDFQPVDGAPGLLDSLRLTGTLLHYALNFLGSAPGFSHPTASPLFGVLLLGSTAALGFLGFPKRNPVLYAALLLLTASAGLNALGRAYISGADYALASTRYRFYSSAMLAVTYLCWAEWIATREARRERRGQPGRVGSVFLALSLAAGLAFSSLSYGFYLPKALETSKKLRGGLLHWSATGRGLMHPDVRHAGAILERAIEQGLYAPDLPSADRTPSGLPPALGAVPRQ